MKIIYIILSFVFINNICYADERSSDDTVKKALESIEADSARLQKQIDSNEKLLQEIQQRQDSLSSKKETKNTPSTSKPKE